MISQIVTSDTHYDTISQQTNGLFRLILS